MKRIWCILLIVCTIGGLVCCNYRQNVDKNGNNTSNTKTEATSRLIRYNNKNYIVITSDLIEKKDRYANILDKLGFDYYGKGDYTRVTEQGVQRWEAYYLRLSVRDEQEDTVYK